MQIQSTFLDVIPRSVLPRSLGTAEGVDTACMMGMFWMFLDIKEMFAEKFIVEAIVAFEYFLAEVDRKK